jgi:hypothetical protein
MRIYDGDFTVARLVEDCSKPRRESVLGDHMSEPREIDIKKLNARLSELPVDAIRTRRKRMNAFYEEVLVSSDPDRGISFTTLLMILAHYNVINDNKSLRLHEFLRRRARLQRVEEAVNRNIVVGFFDTVFWSRKLRMHRHSKDAGRMTGVPQFSVPEIFVDEPVPDDNAVGPFDGGAAGLGPPSVASSTPSSPMMQQGAMTPGSGSDNGADGGLMTRRLGNLPPLITRTRAGSIQISPTASPTTLNFPGLSSPATRSPTTSRWQGHQASPSVGSIGDDWHLAEALSRPTSRDGAGSDNPFSATPRTPTTPQRHGRTLSTRDAAGGEDAESRSRANSNVSAQDVLEVLDNSVWGESIRRSFTTRRPGSGGEPSSPRNSGGKRKN